MITPVVIDIYSGDPVVDFAKTVAFGIVGVIHKASEGNTYADKTYAARRKMWRDAGGKLWGAYHFLHGADPVAEADHFVAVADPDTDTLLALDWETPPHSTAASAAQARAFIERVEAKTGRTLLIYSGNVAKENIHGSDPFFGSRRLWLAQYGTHWTTQQSWPKPWLWQCNGDSYGPGPHNIPGIQGLCDNNVIVAPMTLDDLTREWSGRGVGPATTSPPPVSDALWIQQALNALGANLVEDGKIGPASLTAIRRFIEASTS